MRLIFVLRLHGWIAALDNGRGRLLKCSSRIDSLREEGYRLKRKGGERPARGRSTPARVRTELKWTAASLEIAGGATDADMGTTNIVAPPWFKTWLDTPGRAFREAKAASSTKSVACRSSEVEMTGKSRNATHTSKPTLRMVTQRSWRCAHEFRTHWHRGSAKIRPKIEREFHGSNSNTGFPSKVRDDHIQPVRVPPRAPEKLITTKKVGKSFARADQQTSRWFSRHMQADHVAARTSLSGICSLFIWITSGQMVGKADCDLKAVGMIVCQGGN